MTDNLPDILDNNLSEKEKQEIFLDAYRKADARFKTIKAVCEVLRLPRHQFDMWLADPEFEEQFWGLRRAHSYELEEQLSTISAELLRDEVSISKGRYYALQIAQKSILEIIGKLNRERFGESTEVRLKQEGSMHPVINISLVSAELPAIDISPSVTIDNKKGAEIAPVLPLESVNYQKSGEP
jgi:hypothetical protein